MRTMRVIGITAWLLGMTGTGAPASEQDTINDQLKSLPALTSQEHQDDTDASYNGVNGPFLENDYDKVIGVEGGFLILDSRTKIAADSGQILADDKREIYIPLARSALNLVLSRDAFESVSKRGILMFGCVDITNCIRFGREINGLEGHLPIHTDKKLSPVDNLRTSVGESSACWGIDDTADATEKWYRLLLPLFRNGPGHLQPVQ